jgi:hypothetical protein
MQHKKGQRKGLNAFLNNNSVKNRILQKVERENRNERERGGERKREIEDNTNQSQKLCTSFL